MAIQKVEAPYVQWLGTRVFAYFALPMGSMYAIDGNIYHQYTPNVSIYTIHGSYGLCKIVLFSTSKRKYPLEYTANVCSRHAHQPCESYAGIDNSQTRL